MTHTIVVEIPDGADALEVERLLTSRIDNATLVVGRDEVEYHHEQMTSS